jgi:hypothetical protein
MLFTNWMGSYPYRREVNRHWSVSTPRHRSGDGKTICEERALIGDLFFWTSPDHFYPWWNQRSSFGIFLIFDSDFYLYQSILAAPQSENEFDQQAIYSFEPRPTKFVSLRSQSILRFSQAAESLQNRPAARANPLRIRSSRVITLAKLLRSQSISHTIIPLNPASSELNERNPELKKVSWDENQEMKDIQSYR